MATPFSVFYFPLLGTPTAEGNELTFYEAGLDVPLDVFTDSDGLIPWAQPIVLNAAGEADGVIYVDPDGPALKVVYVDANGVAVPGYPVDNIPPGEILNVMTTSIVTLTNAQIKALPTTNYTLVAAPASGLRVKVFAQSFSANTTAGAYTNINTTYAALSTTLGSDGLTYGPVNDSTTTPALTDVTALLGGAAQKIYDVLVPPSASVTGSAPQYVQNIDVGTAAQQNATLLKIGMDNNGSGALTGGNAANTLTITTYYALESLT